MNKRRAFTICLKIAAILCALAGNFRVDAAPSTPAAPLASVKSPMKALRQKAAERPRRLLFNNDGGDATRKIAEPTVQALLDSRTTPLVGTQVDSLFYCTKTVGLDLMTYFTKIGTVFTNREDIFASNQMEELVAKGIDPLRVMVDFGKKHNIEVFWSLRMNDNHDATRTVPYGEIMFRENRFKTAHPEYMLGSLTKRPKHGAWTALNYALPEVRERVFRLVEEVCRNYDVDGVELDFFRHPVCFEATTRGEPVTDKERALMTELLTRIRRMADEVGQSRGRPILIAVRTPDSVDYCCAIGFDLERWMAGDLIDLYMPAGYFQLNDWDYSVALGHKYGVKVYPSLDETRIKNEPGKAMRMTDLAFRGRAADVWGTGADGVYLFNFPDYYKSDASMLQEMGSSKTLAPLDKDYFGSVRGLGIASGGNLPYDRYVKLETLNPDNPRTINPGETKSAKLSLGDDGEKAASARNTLRLQLVGVESPEHVRVTLNRHALKMAADSEEWLEAPADPSNLHKGRNVVEVALADEASKPVRWADVVLQVRHADLK